MSADTLATQVRIALGCAVVLALLAVRLPALRRYDKLACAFAGVVGLAGFFNFGIQFQQWSPGFLGRWELFHYQLGSKYFPELGFDGLYAASLLAQQETSPTLPRGPLRDLVTYQIVPLADHEPRLREVRARFSEERWRSFVTDHAQYVRNSSLAFWQNIRRDHGYNPTPAWTFVARLFDARLGSSDAALGFLASLDLALLALMFALVFRSFGFEAGCLSLAILGLGFGWRYQLLGALLRFDWLVAVAIGICALKRERFAAAGACFGYAAMVRLFPVLFLAGPALLALKAWLHGERPRWPIRLAAGFAAALCLGVLAGSFSGRGAAAWSEFASHMRVYRQTWFTNNVGLDTLFVSTPVLLRPDDPVDPRSRNEIRSALAEQRVARVAAAGALLALFAACAWRASLAESAVLGVAAIFALTPAPSYYGIMACLVPLRRGRWAPLAVLALATGMYGVSRFYATTAYHAWLYALFAWGNALLLLAWLLPDALRQLRSLRAGAAPAAGPPR